MNLHLNDEKEQVVEVLGEACSRQGELCMPRLGVCKEQKVKEERVIKKRLRVEEAE